MAYEKLTIGVSPITKTVFIGRLNKKGNMWLDGKRDITSDFLRCIEEFFQPGSTTELTVNGEVGLVIEAKKPDRYTIDKGQNSAENSTSIKQKPKVAIPLDTVKMVLRRHLPENESMEELLSFLMEQAVEI
jgi:hypothetical protein